MPSSMQGSFLVFSGIAAVRDDATILVSFWPITLTLHAWAEKTGDERPSLLEGMPIFY
jgi:hypothetical protein